MNPTRSQRTLRASGLTFSSALLTCCLLSGCVAATSYEQAASTAEVQLEAHRRTAKKLEQSEAEMAALRAERDALLAQKTELESDLARKEGRVSEVELGVSTATKERDEQSQLVTHLRGELARAGTHIKDYEAEKSILEEKVASLAAENEKLGGSVAALNRDNAKLKERLSLCPEDGAVDESMFEPAKSDDADGATPPEDRKVAPDQDSPSSADADE